MTKHGYAAGCDCARCLKERARREAQSDGGRARAAHLGRVARTMTRERAASSRWLDRFESGRPMDADDH